LQAQREKEAALETLADREMTIAKFRELVQRMQEQSQELQQRLERESTKPVSALPEILDFKVQLLLFCSVFGISHTL
jgi:dynactin 1